MSRVERAPYRAGPRSGRGSGVPVGRGSRTRRVEHPEERSGKLPGPVPESALYPVVARALVAQGFSCWREASFLGSWIDLFGRAADGRSVALEVKVSDWRRALRQAVRVRNSAERVYVALWAPYVHRALSAEARRLFAQAGVGLLSVNGDCAIKIEAPARRPRYPESVLLTGRPNFRP